MINSEDYSFKIKTNCSYLSRQKNCYDTSGRKKILHPSFTVNQEK